ncbi:helicase C-terminal domain-containing protein [Lysinibacillus capsici]|uniref:helicase C-terminal domain-containing protein n=1 Tax=Lysinibacillus capsici TaxID=2115968 RepID=UPI0028AF0F7C|nr:helicase C-terminal domain-containing protein [Lysinibacillus capsici]
MAFKIPTNNSSKPSSTIELFNKLGKLDRLSLQQGQSLEEYEKLSGNNSDIAIEMPAGHGKTLVGGLIAEFNRVSKGKRVVYCCATRQLASQTHNLLLSYGIKSVLLVNKVKDFSEKDYRLYQRSSSIAVTTYSHIFNTNPAFKDSNLIIFDDAHATEYSINDFWTLEINSYKKNHAEIFNALYSILKDLIPKHTQDKIDYKIHDPLDSVDIIPHPLWIERIESIKELLNVATNKHDGTKKHELSYSWSIIRDYLHACQLYISQDTIAIKPIIAPNKYHSAFNAAQERVYMSATIGANGELERVFGVPDIKRISKFSKGANKVSGRRLLLFPEDHFEQEELPNVLIETIKMQPRVLMLFPSKKSLDRYKEFLIENIPEYTIFLSEDIEDSLDKFKCSEKGILLLAGRYEGIDLKDSDCRLQIIVDLPVAVGISERFLQTRLRVTEILRDRLATRLLQGLGRCTRGTNDYAAVLFVGKNVGEYLNKNDFRKLLPPEIDAELEFGFGQIDNIKDITNWKDSLKLFFDQSHEWEEVEDYIKSTTDQKQQEREEFYKSEESEKFKGIEKCSINEVNFQYSLMEKDYEKCNQEAFCIIENLGRNPIFKGYRALWNYNIACIYNQMGDNNKKISFLNKALSASTNKLWIDRELFELKTEDTFYGNEVEAQLNEIMNKLSTYGDRDKKFERDWDKIIEGLSNKKADIYEVALYGYGTFLGFGTTRPPGKGTPDGIWDFLNYTLVYEAKTNIEDETTAIPLDDIRQAGFHKKWILEHHNSNEERDIKVIILCEKNYIEEYAKHAADDIFLVSPTEFLEKAILYGNILRETIQKLKISTEDDAKQYLATKLVDEKFTILEIIIWLTKLELKTVVN